MKFLKLKKNLLIVSIMAVMLLGIVLIVSAKFVMAETSYQCTEYKSIKCENRKISYSYSEIFDEAKAKKMSALEIVNAINTLEKDYSEYIIENLDSIVKKYPKDTKKQDLLYITYLKNLEYYTELLGFEFEDFFIGFDNYGEFHSNTGEVSYEIEVTKDLGFKKGRINGPNCPTVKLVYMGEGLITSEIDYEYLNSNKGKLGKALQDYLGIKFEIQKDLNNGTYIQDSYVVAGMSDLRKWIKLWEDFLQKYPNFYIKEAINKDIQMYSVHFINSEPMYEYLASKKVSNEVKKEYDLFLKSANTKTISYQIIKKAYDIIKLNNFEYSKDLDLYIHNTAEKYDVIIGH